MADVGQEEDFEAARAKALKVGASKVFIEVVAAAYSKLLTDRTRTSERSSLMNSYSLRFNAMLSTR